ncbi:hypothetical protein [Lysobacter humi (ex Lee et al. 2017)]
MELRKNVATLAAALLLASPLVAAGAEHSLKLQSEPGDFIGLGQAYEFDTGISTLGGFTPGRSFWMEWHSGYDYFSVELAAPEGQLLRVGTFTGATSFHGPASVPKLNVSMGGRACESEGSFTLEAVEFGPHGYVQRAVGSFESRCLSRAATLRGRFTIINPPPPPPVSFSFDLDAKTYLDDQYGDLVATGTLTCSRAVRYAVDARAVQRTPHHATAEGFGNDGQQCAAGTTPLTLFMRHDGSFRATTASIEADLHIIDRAAGVILNAREVVHGPVIPVQAGPR